MVEKEVREILAHIENKDNFLLTGGAGSGKTYSLEHLIRELGKREPLVSVACITYTNAAADILRDRVEHPNIWVSTIHDFLWEIIGRYQIELKKIVCKLHNDQDDNSILRYLGFDITPDDFDKVKYDNFVSAKKGVISHDEVLGIAKIIFEKYPKIADLVQDRFGYIFVDEYQDTSPLVEQILLDKLNTKSRRTIIGFFGDSMQSIYEKTIGNVAGRIQDGSLKEVQKTQNRRNPKSVIDLANQIRNDGLEQEPSKDLNAPNMSDGQVKKGHVLFLHSPKTMPTEEIRDYIGWDFEDVKHVKELKLTHNLIASDGGFHQLMDVYSNDKILEYVKRIRRRVPEGVDTVEKTFDEILTLKEMESLDTSPTNGQQEYIHSHPEAYNLALNQEFDVISRIYIDKDHLLDGVKDDEDENQKKNLERDDLIKHLYRIQEVIFLYQKSDITGFLKKTNFIVKKFQDKQELADAIETLSSSGSITISEAVEIACKNKLIIKDDKFNAFVREKSYIWGRIKEIPYQEFVSLYNYLEGRSALSTQHKVKGNEFDQVLAILNNGNWNNYNFKYLFEEAGNPSVLERTRKLFYVSCTRAKEELVVYFPSPTEKVLATAKKWFGEDNVKNMVGEI